MYYENKHALERVLSRTHRHVHITHVFFGRNKIPPLVETLCLCSCARNGLVYGAKIRFPHALVMVTLFGSGTPRDKWKKIITATRQHAMRLALYVMIYKTTLMVIRDLFRDGKQASIDPFLAGMLGGWYMFGERTPVNEQIVLYCVSRCVAALLPRARVPKDYPTNKVVPIDNTGTPTLRGIDMGLCYVALRE
ncbi:hypothetical protein MGL_2858 [Malassezia globosa CBS 7966]|uniref:Peroxisomal membrane protein 4 n=1 Tax=Malassezia globosa (strain ATCC MYA-4612 / CBS 7966) TaxID=425265 RepID=A8Q661_MALGO|nr:uncharacterized protein MGL_2858 [Malassezia globosa CBS 7966]EDP42658.1 hypothetical protein MGL_2858 [Malassezia globosa CBS 7966]